MKLENVIADRGSKKVYCDKDKIIKIFDNGYSKSDILNEALNQSRVEETGPNVPKIIEVRKIDGKWAIVMEYIEGKTLDQLMKENPKKMDEYLDKFVDLQMHVHTYRCPLLNKLKDKMDRKIDQTQLDDTIKYELHQRLAGKPKHVRLCHGDFNPSNIIVTPEGEYYIIDWSHVTQGNASADVARTYLLFMLAGKEDIAEKYLDLFCQKSNTTRKYVNGWLPIVAASQSVKGKPEEIEMLSKWANVVEFE